MNINLRTYHLFPESYLVGSINSLIEIGQNMRDNYRRNMLTDILLANSLYEECKHYGPYLNTYITISLTSLVHYVILYRYNIWRDIVDY